MTQDCSRCRTMVCFLTAPSHKPNQCWFITKYVPWCSIEGNYISAPTPNSHRWWQRSPVYTRNARCNYRSYLHGVLLLTSVSDYPNLFSLKTLNSNRFIVASNIHRRKIWHEDNSKQQRGTLKWLTYLALTCGYIIYQLDGDNVNEKNITKCKCEENEYKKK